MGNPGVIALVAGLAAQAAKVLVEAVLRRRWRPELFFTNGGMPSSHTATVASLALLVGRREGWNSTLGSLVVVFGLFVMFEATGLRQELGHQAQVLNELMDRALAGDRPDRRRLRELVGHTWAEVLGGAVFGILFTLAWLKLAGGRGD
ncbi:MAG TPA: divergent PAP2 family protein [Candidatus Krumholzibacteria bacterium]|nr:divergent PAP2 family protein [Candidatus Krumholzibacteria bacterium]